ncbi:hypothetical protein KUCAC02_027574, partial [Chaenocephalus aceratus]
NLVGIRFLHKTLWLIQRNLTLNNGISCLNKRAAFRRMRMITALPLECTSRRLGHNYASLRDSQLQLGWPGRVLEPVGLAQGGLATDPGGDGMKSGTSQNTSPGFGAFLAFPPPMAACPASLYSKLRKTSCQANNRKDETALFAEEHVMQQLKTGESRIESPVFKLS